MDLSARAPYSRLVFLLATLFATGPACAAQERVVANLPDAPSPKQQSADAQQPATATYSNSTYGILTRRSFFFPDLAYTTKPLTSRQKFLLAVDQTVAPSALIITASSAAIT